MRNKEIKGRNVLIELSVSQEQHAIKLLAHVAKWLLRLVPHPLFSYRILQTM